MKNPLLFVLLITSLGCEQPDVKFSCPDKEDIEKVLGQEVRHLENRHVSNAFEGRVEFHCTYEAKQKDSTGRLGILYYMAEAYPSEEGARESLEEMFIDNEDNGMKHINGIGDEAVSHTDNTNFQLVMVRKGNKLIRLKINKVTNFTGPIQELEALGKKIVETL